MLKQITSQELQALGYRDIIAAPKSKHKCSQNKPSKRISANRNSRIAVKLQTITIKGFTFTNS